MDKIIWTKVNQFIFAQKTPCEVFNHEEVCSCLSLFERESNMDRDWLGKWNPMPPNRNDTKNISWLVRYGKQTNQDGSSSKECSQPCECAAAEKKPLPAMRMLLYRMRHIQRPFAPLFESYDWPSSWYSTISFKILKAYININYWNLWGRH